MNRQEFLLTLLSEECAEVTQRCTKALRFGLDEVQTGQELSNAARINYEFCDLLSIHQTLVDEGYLPHMTNAEIQAAHAKKKQKATKYDKMSRDLGTLVDSDTIGICGNWTPLKDEEAQVDRSARTLIDGSPVTDDHREINPATGMQKSYVVLSAEERSKGFVRPVRNAYIHAGINPTYMGACLLSKGENGCGTRTEMARSLAETYARDPKFYSGTFCCSCKTHRPLDEFRWEGTTEVLGD